MNTLINQLMILHKIYTDFEIHIYYTPWKLLKFSSSPLFLFIVIILFHLGVHPSLALSSLYS